MRILKPAWSLTLVAPLLLGGCPSEECEDKICLNEPEKPGDSLTASIRVSNSVGWDSVMVELHAAKTVERGRILRTWILKDGQPLQPLSVAEGEYSAKATYMRTGDTLEVFDADRAYWDSREDECGCVTGWSRSNANLDLEED